MRATSPLSVDTKSASNFSAARYKIGHPAHIDLGLSELYGPGGHRGCVLGVKSVLQACEESIPPSTSLLSARSSSHM